MNKIRKLSVLVFLFIIGRLAVAGVLPGPLVETEWLAANADKVTILDVRQDVKSFTTPPQFVKDKKTGKEHLVRIGGHIPGALLVNYKNIRVTRKIDGREVTRLLPAKADFEKLMQDAGLNKDRAVVVVSKGQSDGDVTMATRLYWQLKYYGQDEIAILNGGMAQWLNERRGVDSKADNPQPGNWQATAERKELLATSADVANAVDKKSAQLVDTRSLPLYFGTGKKSYVYAKGHIPGAKPFPNELLTQPSVPAKFTPIDELRSLAKEMGVDTDANTITYCNSGHLASGSWFVLHELMGNKNVKLYDGSMHQWTMEERPVTSFKME